MSHTAIVNATLIDGQGGNPVPNATILIEGNTFAAVGTAESVLVPDDAVVVDADGRTVIPGILNGNVHLIDGWLLCFPGGVEYLARWEGRLVDVIVEAAQVTLKNGVTTVFDTYNAVGPVLAARDKIAAGDAAGSRVFAAGNIVGMGGPFSVDFRAAARPHISRTFADRMDALFSAGVGSELMGLTANDVRPIIRDYLQRGVDMLKIAVSDHATGVVGFDRAYLSFSERVLETMVEEALDAGVPLLSHTTHLESLRIAVDLGFDVLIHGSMVGMHSIPQKQIDRIREKGLTVGIQTTTEAYIQKLIAAGNPFGYMLGGVNAENERRIIAAGIPVMLGTDAGCTSHDVLSDTNEVGEPDRPWTLGLDHVAWARGIVEKGMTPMRAIQSSTRDVARAYRKGDILGTIEAGKLADLVILDADPLTDIANLAAVSVVFKDGVRIDRESLPTEPLVTAITPRDPS